MYGPNFETGYLVIYRNEDRTFSPGFYIHRERACAVAAIPPDEKRDVLCIAEIHGVKFNRTRELATAQAFKAEQLQSDGAVDGLPPVSVIVTGPKACGKTRNAERLRQHFGLNRIIDDWDGHDRFPPLGALLLTNIDELSLQQGAAQSVRVIAYHDAADAAGLTARAA